MNIWIINDHPLVGEAICSLLTSEWSGAKVEFKGSNWEKTIEDLKAGARADLVFLDLNILGVMGGYRFLEQIQAQDLDARVVVLSMHAEAVFIDRAISLGANGYVVKSDPPEELAMVAKLVLAGEVAYSSTAQDALQSARAVGSSELSAREREVAEQFLKGLTSREIATKLAIRYRSVECHRLNIMKKLKVHNAAQLVAALRAFGEGDRKLAPGSDRSLEWKDENVHPLSGPQSSFFRKFVHIKAKRRLCSNDEHLSDGANESSACGEERRPFRSSRCES